MRKSKKAYAFTDKQKRRDNSINEFYLDTVGKVLKRQASKQFRRTNKYILYKTLAKGEEYPFLRYRKYMKRW